MSQIIRGTTPTFEYIFNDINPSDFEECFFTIKQKGKVLVEKNLSNGIIDENSISYILSQEETLSLEKNNIATAYLDWKLSTGVRGAGSPMIFQIVSSAKETVI